MIIRKSWILAAVMFSAGWGLGCGEPDAEDGSNQHGEAPGGLVQGEENLLSVTYDLPIGVEVEVCHTSRGVNQRSGPSTAYMVLRVLPEGTRGTTLDRSGNWYRVDASGNLGWVFGEYLCSAPTPNPRGSMGGGSFGRATVLDNSKAFVGFSYYWGGARLPFWSTDYGVCYSSTYGGHGGANGADCSGYVAKVWEVPEAMPFEDNLHPFSTADFYSGYDHWYPISRNDTEGADALVYRSNGSGHVFIFETGDAWGDAWTYEARGCAYGVVHNLRTVSASYQARRLDQF